MGGFVIFNNMGQRLIITEQDRETILNNHNLVSEGMFDNIINTLKNTKIYKLVYESYDSNPIKFAENIISKAPKFEQYKQQIINQAQKINSMSQKQKSDYVNNNKTAALQNLKTADNMLQEQFFWYGLALVMLIYCIIGIMRSPTPKEKEAEKQKLAQTDYEKQQLEKQKQDDERQRLEDEKLKYEPINRILRSNFIGKTLNLYEDTSQQSMNSSYSPITIESVEFKQVNPSLKGVLIKGRRQNNENLTVEDILGGQLVAVCKYNPDEFSNQMGVFDFVGRNQKQFYNKKFTDKLNELGGEYCKKPQADFGALKTRSDIERTV